MAQPPLRVGFFLDGFTLKKVNEYYRHYHRFHSNLDFRGLKLWVQMNAVRYFAKGRFPAIEMESHYYHPYRNPHVYGRDVEGVLRFEHELQSAGYQVHFNEAQIDGVAGPNLKLMEDALLFASYCRMEAAVLFTTQGQFAPLPDRLRMLGIPTLVLGWDFIYPKAKRTIRWKTDTYLRETCAHYVAMEKVAEIVPGTSRAPRPLFFQSEHPFDRGPVRLGVRQSS